VTPARKAQRLWLALGGFFVALLAAAIFTLGSLNTPIHLQGAVLFAVTMFVVSAFLVFASVLARSLLRLRAERRAQQLGSRFKTRMVLGAMGISLLPVIFLFFASYALMNRTLNKWFPRPLEIATHESRQLLDQLTAGRTARLDRLARDAGKTPGADRSAPALVRAALAAQADAAWTVDDAGRVRAGATAAGAPLHPRLTRTLGNGAELWQAGGTVYFTGRAHYPGYDLVAAERAPPGLLARLDTIETELRTYQKELPALRAYKNQILLVLGLFTVLLLFSATWVALFLSRQVTVPIQALAEATQEISRGNFAHRVTVQARDELGSLVRSFNRMVAQLGENRERIEDFTRNLQQALAELEHRRSLLTTLLESIPTGVLLVDPRGRILQANRAVERLFGARAAAARTLDELLGAEAARSLFPLMRRSLRMGSATREFELGAGDRLLHTALTVSSFGPDSRDSGYVVVIDDLTELLRAQKAAAWQEVAQRIAHEIKNPLTPIQLSAERLERHVERSPAPRSGKELAGLVRECATMIRREVAALKSLVDEFSQFARFPAARLAPADLNEIVAEALALFRGRLNGIAIETDWSASRPQVKADAELLRRVVANLIDNAAEAMEASATRRLSLATRLDPNRDAVEVVVSDTGHGISPEAKDKLFLPQFSTRSRGTGLGLAIASRIIAEHHGTIRVEDNLPAGTRFIIRLPLAGAPAAERQAVS
jgi:two-component system, NtrC family, nitrogen regulation sensor histidine kinase NtrY